MQVFFDMSIIDTVDVLEHVLNRWLLPIASLVISGLLAWLAYRTHKRDTPDLQLGLQVFHREDEAVKNNQDIFSHSWEYNLVVGIINVGYRDSAPGFLKVDNDIFDDKLILSMAILNSDDKNNRCLDAGKSWHGVFEIDKEKIEKLKKSKKISITELNGREYRLSRKIHKSFTDSLQRF